MLFNKEQHIKKVFDVPVSEITREETVEAVIEHAQQSSPFSVAFMPVHSLMIAVENEKFKKAIESFDIVAPDGQPVKWALNHFHKCGLKERVYGPDTTLDICAKAEEKGLSVFFYGSSDEVLTKLKVNLKKQFPNLTIAGTFSPPFSSIEEIPISDHSNKIKESGADILFTGLGCPKQELITAVMKIELSIPICAVGAAFDFHAGTLAQAPVWMQKKGLEWLFRLVKEPKRLFKRYFYYNSWFILKIFLPKLFPSRKK